MFHPLVFGYEMAKCDHAYMPKSAVCSNLSSGSWPFSWSIGFSLNLAHATQDKINFFTTVVPLISQKPALRTAASVLFLPRWKIFWWKWSVKILLKLMLFGMITGCFCKSVSFDEWLYLPLTHKKPLASKKGFSFLIRHRFPTLPSTSTWLISEAKQLLCIDAIIMAVASSRSDGSRAVTLKLLVLAICLRYATIFTSFHHELNLSHRLTTSLHSGAVVVAITWIFLISGSLSSNFPETGFSRMSPSHRPKENLVHETKRIPLITHIHIHYTRYIYIYIYITYSWSMLILSSCINVVANLIATTAPCSFNLAMVTGLWGVTLDSA